MRDQSRDDFISASTYTDPVDIKKLGFIFSALDRYVGYRRTEFENLQVLEVGCGRGGISLPLASLGCTVTAFDIDREAVAYCQAQALQRNVGNITFTVSDGCTFDDGRVYDFVVASEVLEHVREPSRLAENISRRMMEGSYLVVTAPNGYGPWELKNRVDVRTYLRKWNALRRLLGKTPYIKGGGVGHCQFYTKVRLLELFSKLSLRLIASARSDSFLTVFSRLRGNSLLGRLDSRLADILPYWLASGWYFVFQLRRE